MATVTATRARSSATLLWNSRFLVELALALLVVPGLLTRGIAHALFCGADILYPTSGLQFYYLDTINVTYESNFSQPTLSCLCGEPGRTSEKFRVDNATPFGSELVLLNFSSSDPCWFDLRPDAGECGDAGDSSTSFALWPGERPGSARTTIGLLSATSTPTAIAAVAATDAAKAILPGIKAPDSAPTATASPTPTTVAPPGPPGGGPDLSPGAKAGLGIGIALLNIALAAMAAFLYFRRRKKGQDTDLAGAIIDHDRRHGRKAPERTMGREFAPSVTSGNSDEPLYPIQPVFDGFPGSMGYDDVRSLHSTDHHSPTGGHSPNVSYGGGGGGGGGGSGGYWTDRDELTAARAKSQPILPIVTSYGPNPVTPTLTPRPSSRVDLNIRAGSVSTDSREGIPPMPPVPLMPDYSTYSLPPPPMPETTPSPPRVPAVVSYGPNRVTPTPAVTTPTVPPDENIYKRRLELEQELPASVALTAATALPPRPITSHDRQFSWEPDEPIEPMMASGHGPLPPYASTADFYAMEKGAIRKLAEPQAQAELPPTKDGFYHYTSDVVEYELPGAAPQNEPQLPFHHRAYKRGHPEAGPSGAGGLREIDEQKFLLSAEISDLRAQKQRQKEREKEKARARRSGEREDEGDGEEYDLGERTTLSR